MEITPEQYRHWHNNEFTRKMERYINKYADSLLKNEETAQKMTFGEEFNPSRTTWLLGYCVGMRTAFTLFQELQEEVNEGTTIK